MEKRVLKCVLTAAVLAGVTGCATFPKGSLTQTSAERKVSVQNDVPAEELNRVVDYHLLDEIARREQAKRNARELAEAGDKLAAAKEYKQAVAKYRAALFELDNATHWDDEMVVMYERLSKELDATYGRWARALLTVTALADSE